MAKASFKLPEEFLLKLSTLGSRTDEILESVLEAGGEVVAQKVASNLNAVLSHESTGELAGALGVSPAKQDRNGNYNVKIGFSEPRTDGKSNSMIAGVLEYGRHGQPARPFMKPAQSSSKAAAINAMQERFDEEVKTI